MALAILLLVDAVLLVLLVLLAELLSSYMIVSGLSCDVFLGTEAFKHVEGGYVGIEED